MRGQIIKRCCGQEGTRCCPKERYLIRIYLGRIQGKRKYFSTTVHGTRKQAQKTLTSKLHELDRGALVEPSRTSLGDYMETWLAGKVIEKTTYRNYRTRIDKDIIPGLGHHRLDKLSRAHIRLWLAELAETYAPGTLQMSYQVLRQALQQAVEDKILATNPCQGLRKVTGGRRKGYSGRPLTKQQVGKLLEATRGDRYHALWVLLLGTGMRPQEALALKWDDIDEVEGWCHIRRVWADNRSHEARKIREMEAGDTGKTDRSFGTIRLPKTVLRTLMAHYRDQQREKLRSGSFRWNQEGWVFTTQHGQPPLHPNIHVIWKKACKKAEVPPVRLYDTRHTAATLHLEGGRDLKEVSTLLRHSSVGITGDVYVGVTNRMKSNVADAAEDTIFGEAATG